MRLRILTLMLTLIVFLSLIPASKAVYFEIVPRVYFRGNQLQEPVLSFEQDYSNERIELGPNENIILSISRVENRIFNPLVEIEVSISRRVSSESPVDLELQLRCDGDGDGVFEYIVIFEDVEFTNQLYPDIEVAEIIGEPIDMNGGTIEFEINRTDDLPGDFIILSGSSWVSVPFDSDPDRDGIGNWSDPDNDNDGHPDHEDDFPNDRGEWKDTDGDGIGDNEDKDDNNNRIPDVLEIPLALFLIVVPFLIIYMMLKRIKKINAEKTDEKEEEIDTSEPKSSEEAKT